MGASAGGGLAARLALFNRDRNKFPVKGQVLIYPMLDYRIGTKEAPMLNPLGGQLVWSPELNQLGWTTLHGGQNIPEDKMPYFSPSMENNLECLPSTFMLVGNMDLFSIEDYTYAQRLVSEGIPTEFHQIHGVYHMFDVVEPQSPQTHLAHSLEYSAIRRMLEA